MLKEVAARAALAALSALGDIKLKESLTSGASKQQGMYYPLRFMD